MRKGIVGPCKVFIILGNAPWMRKMFIEKKRDKAIYLEKGEQMGRSLFVLEKGERYKP